MSTRLLTLAAASAALLGCFAGFAAGNAPAAPADPRLAAVHDWAFAIGAGALGGDLAARYREYDLIVIDGEEATPAQVATLRTGGRIVLGYLSVGTIEPFRPWYRRLKRFRLPDEFEEFNEPYARLNAKGYRRQVAGRIAPKILRKGFDGLFLDNTDMVEIHKRQRRGLRALVASLAARVDQVAGRFLFTQNGARVIGPTLAFYDGWNREDVTWTYGFKRRRYQRVRPRDAAAARAELIRIGAAGLLTTATDYTAGDELAAAESVASACSTGALPFVSNIGLRRIPPVPFGCG
jgi:endo-alpha-1,4-polygalactosaminidase (GH114 family)